MHGQKNIADRGLPGIHIWNHFGY